MRILRIDELRYSEIIEQLGYEYLHAYYGDKDGNIDDFSLELINIMTHSKAFWIWWLFRWNNNDAKYLRQSEIRYDLRNVNAYINYHKSLFYPVPAYLLKNILLTLNTKRHATERTN